MKLSDRVASYIAEVGVKHVFLLSGGGCMHLVDSIGKESKLTYIACLHEQAAAIAADGYAQYSGNLGVALVTTGPGSTNAITGVAGSWIESVPLLIISGQVKTTDIKPGYQMRMLGFQEVDIVSMVKPITKYAVTVTDPKSILYHLQKASFLARSGRPGPVWIDIPLDIQASYIDENCLVQFNESELYSEKAITKPELTRLVAETFEMLSVAKRPVIIAGNGIKLAKCQSLFRTLIEKLEIPVLTTWKGCDLISEDNLNFYGRPGSVGQRGANFTQQNSDFILSLGARLDFGQIGYAQETFAREAKKVIVDIDENEFIKFRFNVDLKINVDVKDFLEEMDHQISDFVKPDWEKWHNKCLIWKKKYPVVLPEYKEKMDFVSTYALVDAISDLLQSDDIVVPCSSGSGADITSQTFRVKEGQRVINSPGIGAMGFGIPHTIGVCLAGNYRRTICINGDGGFQLNIQELETIKRLNLPIKFFYLNNQGYVSIRTTQNNYFEGRYVATGVSSGLTLPDIQKVSYAYGINHNQIKNNSELRIRIEEALASEGPFICEVLVDPGEQVSPKVKSILDSKGKMVSKPLEDLAPFLDRNEFLENMIVKPLEE